MINRINIWKTLATALLFTLAGAGTLQAQKVAREIAGLVTDRFGNPLHGAMVVSSEGKNAMVTDFHGMFDLMVSDGSGSVTVSYPGYASSKVDIAGEIDDRLSIALDEDSFDRDLPINLGYSTFRKEEISGAVSTVRGKSLESSPVQTLSESFAGRLPGLTTFESSSEPSEVYTSMLIRGFSTSRQNQPVVIVDGIVYDYNQAGLIDMLSMTEVEAVTILKDAASQAIYGIQGGDGIIVITTKRGRPGKLEINVRADVRVQQVSTTPTLFSSGAYAEMRNQALVNDGISTPAFSPAEVSSFYSGADRLHYPENIWYNMYFRKVSLVERANVDLYGGNESITYYSNVNVSHQGSHFKVADNGKYNPNFKQYKVSFRTNVDLKINKFLSADLKLAGRVGRYNEPYNESQSSLYGGLFDLPPTTFGPTIPIETDPDTGETIGGGVVTTQNVVSPIYGRINSSGYQNQTYSQIYSQIGLKLDMGFLAKGLELSGTVGYRTENNNILRNSRTYEKYTRIGSLDQLNFDLKGSDVDGPLNQSKVVYVRHTLTYKGMLNYRNTFGRHTIGAAAFMFFQKLTKNDTGQPWNFPYARAHTGYEVSYNFDDRYLVRFDAGYSGSEQYAREGRFIWTPAFSAAWVLSNEKFMDWAPWLSMFKLRGSYGITATDRSGLSRFEYLDDVELNGMPNWLEWQITENKLGNSSLHAEKIKKSNIGIDLGFLNQINLSVDFFREYTDDMIMNSDASIPSYFGYASMFPKTNGAKFRNEGFEVTLDYSRKLNKDWSFGAGGWLSYSRNKLLFNGEVPEAEDYAYRYRQEGYPSGQQWGYLVDYEAGAGNGYFNVAPDLANAPEYTIGNPRLGDLIYKDVNEDGKIDSKDMVPLGEQGHPPVTYAFYGNLNWKGLEFSVLFQGIGRWNRIMTGTGIFEGSTGNDGIYSAMHTDAWTPERFAGGDKITYPALSTRVSTSHQNSDFFLFNRQYLRLKNLEIAYNLPQKWMRKVKIDNVRVSLSGQNLWTWDKMKTKDFGPEGSYQSFPVMRIYNLGISMQF